MFVAWRYHISAVLALPSLSSAAGPDPDDASGDSGGLVRGGVARPRRVFVWLQDVVPTRTYTRAFVGTLDGIFCLSRYHVATLNLGHLALRGGDAHAGGGGGGGGDGKALITPNGIDAAWVVDGANAGARFAYGSAPNRGLETVLLAWGEIRARVLRDMLGRAPPPEDAAAAAAGSDDDDDVTLHVYYGFSDAFVRYGRENYGADHFDAWHAMMLELLRQPGVRYDR